MVALLDRRPVLDEVGVDDEGQLWLIAKHGPNDIDMLYALTTSLKFYCYGETPDLKYYRVPPTPGWIRVAHQSTVEFKYFGEVMIRQTEGDNPQVTYIHPSILY